MLPKALSEPATGGRAGGVRERGGRRGRSAAERAAESQEEGAPGVPSSSDSILVDRGSGRRQPP